MHSKVILRNMALFSLGKEEQIIVGFIKVQSIGVIEVVVLGIGLFLLSNEAFIERVKAQVSNVASDLLVYLLKQGGLPTT
mmetsp:Transcript_37506/g.36061  ORF Transcript_37506/g.36061 Transcript_37506/m.36061 type:complete len:80 (-) Transcript_37506:117-356(-)